jgi:hypothetical protein
MSRRTKRIRKRQRQKRRHVLRESAKKLIAAKGLLRRIICRPIIGDLSRPLSSRAFDEVLQETQNT